MRKFMGSGLVVAMVGVAGCATDEQGETTTAECPAALRTAQGVSVQGLSVQGLSVQGFSAQGLSPQGVSPQGVSPQGVSPQGVSPQGVSPQGAGKQGVTPQGLGVQGFTAQGLEPTGISAQDLASRGFDLRGVALRGVTSEEAESWVAGDGALDAEQIVFVRVSRSTLIGHTVAGSRLLESDLVGLLLPFAATTGETLWIGITRVSRHPDAQDLPLYALEIEGESLCADPAGGMFVPGIWDESGARHDSIVSGDRTIDTTFSCTAGVIAKCVAWGYRPWSEGAEIHQACTRMARADYCGDGVPHTEEGTLIDMFDTRGIQNPVADDGLSFEAGWGVNGAVCVRETRYVDVSTSGSRIYPSCWADKPRCDTFEQAVGLGAELGNDSAHATRSHECGF